MTRLIAWKGMWDIEEGYGMLEDMQQKGYGMHWSTVLYMYQDFGLRVDWRVVQRIILRVRSLVDGWG